MSRQGQFFSDPAASVQQGTAGDRGQMFEANDIHIISGVVDGSNLILTLSNQTSVTVDVSSLQIDNNTIITNLDFDNDTRVLRIRDSDGCLLYTSPSPRDS